MNKSTSGGVWPYRLTYHSLLEPDYAKAFATELNLDVCANQWAAPESERSRDRHARTAERIQLTNVLQAGWTLNVEEAAESSSAQSGEAFSDNKRKKVEASRGRKQSAPPHELAGAAPKAPARGTAPAPSVAMGTTNMRPQFLFLSSPLALALARALPSSLAPSLRTVGCPRSCTDPPPPPYPRDSTSSFSCPAPPRPASRSFTRVLASTVAAGRRLPRPLAPVLAASAPRPPARPAARWSGF